MRVVNRNGKTWFVANDVASALGYLKPRNTISVGALSQGSLDPQTKIIPERDVYRLVMKSKLPSIRRTGRYMVSTSNETPEQILSRSSSFNN